MPAIHLLIRGKVQGVFYRATAKKMADKMRITGWIKNIKDGDVEVFATGNEKNLQEFIDWCKKGPDKSQVTEIITTPEPERFFKNFEILRG